ncbi:MAG: hypothetical protein SFY56_11865 [Bacteroidota bacterium]|nr:hypothetical protein [Bacteroidota bacterium]
MKFCFAAILFFISSVLLSQKATKIDSLKKLGRDSLIKLAVQKLNEPGFDASAYDRVTVKATTTSLEVDFDLSVRFYKSGMCYYDNVFVSLIGGNSGNSIQGDCKEPKYYKLSEEQKKKVEFVFKSINKSDEVGHIPNNKINKGTTMKITEKLTHYYVEVSSWSTYSHYEVDKVTGKISQAGHKHYARSGDEKPDYEEVE